MAEGRLIFGATEPATNWTWKSWRIWLKEALQGRFRPHHRFLLEEILKHLDYLDGAIERLSQEVLSRIIPFSALIELMDLIPGIDQWVAEGILSEIGADMNYKRELFST